MTIEIPKIDMEEFEEAFRNADYEYLDMINDRKIEAVKAIYNKVMAGGYAYYDTKNYRHVLHHSAKYDCLQLTNMIINGDDFEMIGDAAITNVDKLDREVPDGVTFQVFTI